MFPAKSYAYSEAIDSLFFIAVGTILPIQVLLCSLEIMLLFIIIIALSK